MNTLKNITGLCPLANSLRKYHTFLCLLLTLCLCAFVLTPLQSQTQRPWQWVKQLGGEGLDVVSGIVRDSKNNIYITGGYFHSLQTSGSKINSYGNQDIFLAKFDEHGNMKNLWGGGSASADYASCIAVSKTDQVILGGSFTDSISLGKLKETAPGKCSFLTSITPKGQFLWLKKMLSEGSASITTLATDSQGNIYALGSFTGKLTIDGFKVASAGKSDIFIAKLTAEGNVVKMISMGGEDDDFPNALAVNDSAGIICTGGTGKTFQLAGFSFTGNPANPRANAFMIGFDSQLSPKWSKEFLGEDYCVLSSLAFDSQNNFYASGSYNFKVKTIDTSFVSKGYSDALLLKYSSQGKLLWGRSIGSWYYDYANRVVVDKLDGAIVTGTLGDTLQIDSISVSPKSPENSALVLQFSPGGKVVWGDCVSGNGRNLGSGATLDTKGNLYLAGTFRNTFMKEDEEMKSKGGQDVFLAKYFNCLSNQGEISGDTIICPGMETFLSVKAGFNNILWNDSLIDSNEIRITRPGKYWAQMTDKRGCVLSDTVTVAFSAIPGFSLGNDTSLLASDSLLLEAPASYSNYLWIDGSTRSYFLAKAPEKTPGNYIVALQANDAQGCLHADTVAVKFLTDYQWLTTNVSITSWPNPATDQFNWKLNTEKPCKLIAELIDEHGKVIYQDLIENYSPGEIHTIDIQNIAMGPYYLRIKGGKDHTVRASLRIIKR